MNVLRARVTCLLIRITDLSNKNSPVYGQKYVKCDVYLCPALCPNMCTRRTWFIICRYFDRDLWLFVNPFTTTCRFMWILAFTYSYKPLSVYFTFVVVCYYFTTTFYFYDFISCIIAGMYCLWSDRALINIIIILIINNRLKPLLPHRRRRWRLLCILSSLSHLYCPSVDNERCIMDGWK